MEVTDTDIYKSDQVFTRGQMITVTGIDNLNEWWIDPDFFEKQSRRLQQRSHVLSFVGGK